MFTICLAVAFICFLLAAARVQAHVDFVSLAYAFVVLAWLAPLLAGLR
jgi:hypothetical protein